VSGNKSAIRGGVGVGVGVKVFTGVGVRVGVFVGPIGAVGVGVGKAVGVGVGISPKVKEMDVIESLSGGVQESVSVEIIKTLSPVYASVVGMRSNNPRVAEEL